MLQATLRDRNGPGRRRFPFALILIHAGFGLFAPAGHADEATDALPVIESDPVTISATRTERSVLDIPGNVTVIDRAEIERSGATSVPEILRREAGVFVTNTTGHPEGTTLESRGFNNGGGNGCSTLVLVDGRPVNEPDTGCPDWSFLPLEGVDRIDVVRGPVSAAWGSGAMGGVIHIHTRGAAAEDGVQGSVRVHSGGYSDDGFALQVSGRSGPVSASAFHETTDTDSFRERADYRGENTKATFGYRLSETLSVGLQGGISSSQRERPGAIDLSQVTDRRSAQTSGDDAGVSRERFLQGRLDWQLWPELRVSLLPRHRQSKSTGLLTGAFPGGSFSFDSEDEVDTLGLDLETQWDGEFAGRPVRLLAGASVAQHDIDSATLSTTFFAPFPPTRDVGASSARRKLAGGFLQAEIWLRDDVLLSLGARRDRSRLEGFATSVPAFGPAPPDFDGEVRQTAWSPRAAATWRISANASVYASVSRGVRFPNLFETFGSFGFSPGLEPEKSKNYELGAKWRSERVQLGATLYHMNVRDEIFFVFNTDPLVFSFGNNENVRRVRHRGLELSGRLRLFEWLDAYGTYTYDDVEIRRERSFGQGQRVPITPRHRGTLGFTATLPFGFEAGLNANYVGARGVANSLDGAVGELGKYATYDARLGWKHTLSEGLLLQIDAIGHNLTDREYSDFAGFSTFSRFVGSYPARDRHYTVSARLSFEL